MVFACWDAKKNKRGVRDHEVDKVYTIMNKVDPLEDPNLLPSQAFTTAAALLESVDSEYLLVGNTGAGANVCFVQRR